MICLFVAAGCFEYMFTEVGVYHYWSGMFDGEHFMQGSVYVTEMEQKPEELKAKFAGFEPEIQTSKQRINVHILVYVKLLNIIAGLISNTVKPVM